MALKSTRKFLAKAAHVTADLTGGTDGGLLSAQQAKEFIRVATNPTSLIKMSRNEDSDNPIFEVPRISFHGRRILKSLTEGALAAAQQTPVSGLVSLITNGFRGEVQISDEVFEDNIERNGYQDTLMTLVAEAVGRDVEELAIKSKTTHSDTDYNDFNGLVAQLDASVPAGQQYNATGVSDVETILANLLELMPDRYRPDPSQLVMFVPQKMADAWNNALSQRGTNLGDEVLTTGKSRPYRGVPIQPVSLLSGNEAGLGSIDYSGFAFMTNPKNVITGWHRKIRLENYRDPRLGSRFIIPSVRFDIKVGEYDAVTFAENIGTL